ncbi:MAG: hypothetical protein JXA04_03205 [Gammaproteobacteria bacterium]|nr:hypothetical protein [Gammaproteobacteria bacterium]
MAIQTNNRLTCLLSVLIASLYSQLVFAAGVPANTTISNTATVDYEIGGVAATANATVTFTVVELLDVSLLWQDAANVSSSSRQNNVVITYELTNIGNGSDQYLLAVDGAIAGDDFDIAPIDLEIWIDNGDGLWSSATDTLYTGANGPVLNGGVAGSDAIVIFVVADVQAGLSAGELSNIQLNATSDTANTAGQTGNVGAEIIGAGDGGVNANVGLTGAIANAAGTIEIVSSGVSINKSVTVIDTLGGNDPHTGAILRYRLDVQISGSVAIDNLIIVDPTPAVTTYTPGSIRLNSAVQTDAQDAPADYSDFNVSNANSITVDLSQGSAVSIAPPATFIIEFEVTIN